MAAADPSAPYRLIWQSDVREAVLQLARQARARRLSVSFAADLELVEARLRTDPRVWGDPLYDLHTLGPTCHRGLSVFLCLYCFVDDQHRAVVIQSVEPHPYGPLAG